MPAWPIYALLAVNAACFLAGAAWGIAYQRERAKRAYRWPCWRCRELELGVKRYTETKKGPA